MPASSTGGEALGSLDAILDVEDLGQWQREAEAPSDAVVLGDDLALIIYTSGTTGRSKGAMITHNNVLATVTGLLSAWAWEQDDRLLLCLPLFHVHGLIVGLHCALAAGATVLMRQRFDAASIVADLASGRADALFCRAHHLRASGGQAGRVGAGRSVVDATLLLGQRTAGRRDPPGLRATHRPSDPRTLRHDRDRHESEQSVRRSASARQCGHAAAGRLHAHRRRRDGRCVPPGDEGMLLVRGSNVFSAYWNAPEKTAESFVHDDLGQRWFVTGDLARQDPATGYVTLLGRSHELIISGGFNIYPREIEEVLETFDGVAEAAVVGRPDSEWGEVPVAYLVCTGPVYEEALTIFCRSQLASFKAPRRFVVVDELPRNAMGKLQKHLLK